MKKKGLTKSELYQDFFARMNQGFCIIELVFNEFGDPVDYYFEEVNKTFEEQTGLQNPVGKSVLEVIPNLEPYWVQAYGGVVKTGKPAQFIEYAEALGRWFQVYAYQLGGKDSRKVAIVFTDISKRRQQETEITILQKQLSNMVDHVGSGLMLFSSKEKVLQANDLMAGYHGYGAKKEMLDVLLTGITRRFFEKFEILDEWREPVLPDRLPVKRAFAGAENSQLTVCQIEKSSGKERWLFTEARRIPIEESDFRILYIANDITLRKSHQQMEASLLATETRFRFMADNISQLAWMTDATGYIFWYNQRWFDYTGTNLEEMQGWGWTKVHHEDHVDRVVKKVSKCFAEGRNWEDTFPLRGKDGEYRWFLSRAVVIRDEQGAITNWFGTNTDFTDQLEASEKLSYQKGLLEAQQKTSPMGILVIDPNRKILMYNKRFEEIYGLQEVNLVGKQESYLRKITQHLFKTGDKPNTVLRRIYRTRAQIHDKFSFVDGRVIEWFGAPVIGENGAYFGYAFSYIDVTEQENLMRQKDEFLGVASHELKTPVTSILAYTQILKKQFEASGDTRTSGMLSKMNLQINRLIILINDLLDVTKIEQGRLSLRKERFDFNEMVREVVEDVQSTSTSHQITIQAKESRSLYGDRDRIGQVVINFLTNAIKYSPRSKTVDIAIDYYPKEVKLSVRDYGLGLDEGDQERVFERFFRVDGKDRETFSGLGLGLFICAEIIQRHEGQIGVQSELGKGSKFFFTLPLK